MEVEMTVQEWTEQAKAFKGELEAASTVEEVRVLWKKHLGLGHKVLGRILTGWNIDEMAEKRGE